MFDEIIVAIEGTDRDIVVATLAAALARQLNVSWSVVSVVVSADAIRPQQENLKSRLAKVGLAEAHIEVVEDRDAAKRITAYFQQRPGALSCLSTHARPPVGEALFGSVAAEVVRGARTPVVVAGPSFQPRHDLNVQSVLVCLDTSELSEAILPHATEVSQRTGAKPWLVQVLRPDRVGLRTASDTMGESSYLRREARRLRDDRGIAAEWDVLHGDDPGKSIADYARGLPGAMIAMTTHGRSGLSQLVAGSVAHHAIRNADCPVLVVRP